MQYTIKMTGLILFAYLSGAIPWGWVFTRLFTSVDIRREGSGNIGATNVMRVAGAGLGAVTLAADMIKGALPVYLAVLMAPPGSQTPYAMMTVAAVVAFLGHLFPVFLRGRGGKGVAVTAGSLLAISPGALLFVAMVFLLIVFADRRVSLGSMGASLVLPLSAWTATGSGALLLGTLLMTVMILLRHEENLMRVLRGTEPRIGGRPRG